MILFFYLKHLRIEFDEYGNLLNITNRDTSLTLPFLAHGLYWYTSKYLPFLYRYILTSIIGFQGNNSKSQFQSSGAYYFRPLKSDPLPISNTRNM
jgi:hypothetical protein